MTDRELDAAVAEKVMGWKRPSDDAVIHTWISPYGLPVFWSPSSDHNAVAKVRERIAELGLIHTFVLHIDEGIGRRKDWVASRWESMNATPRQQCEAALAAVGAQP